PQQKCIDDHPQQRFSFAPAAIGNSGAYDNIRLTCVSKEQSLKGREHRHKQRSAMPAAKLSKAIGKRWWNDQRLFSPSEALNWRPRPVRWKVQQRRSARQSFSPI